MKKKFDLPYILFVVMHGICITFKDQDHAKDTLLRSFFMTSLIKA